MSYFSLRRPIHLGKGLWEMSGVNVRIPLAVTFKKWHMVL